MITLTVAEIRELAQFAGMKVEPAFPSEEADESETEITIIDGPKAGVLDEDDGTVGRYAHVAYITEYPEEGVCPLGPKLTAEERTEG